MCGDEQKQNKGFSGMSVVIQRQKIGSGQKQTAPRQRNRSVFQVSTYDISIDDTKMVKQKSSGLIVSTGSGSTSWFFGMNRVEDTNVLAILETMQSMGLGVNGGPLKDLSSEIAKRINDKIPFEVDHPSMFSSSSPI